MPPARFYRRTMYRAYDYRATWLPNAHLELGDVIVIKRHRVRKVSDLKSLKVEFEIEEDPTPGDLELISSNDVNVTFKPEGSIVDGSSLLEAHAGFIVTFEGKRGFTFRANGTRENSIKDTIALREPILNLYKQGKWDKNFVIVTSLVEAESGTVIIAIEREAKIELKANGEVDLEKINLADLKAELQATFSRGIHTKIIADEGSTPLYKVQGIITKRSRIAALRGAPMKGDDVYAFGDDSFDELTPERAKTDMKDVIDFGEIVYREEEDEIIA